MIAASVSDECALRRCRLQRSLSESICGGSSSEVACQRFIADLVTVALQRCLRTSLLPIELSVVLVWQQLSMPVARARGLGGPNVRKAFVAWILTGFLLVIAFIGWARAPKSMVKPLRDILREQKPV